MLRCKRTRLRSSSRGWCSCELAAARKKGENGTRKHHTRRIRMEWRADRGPIRTISLRVSSTLSGMARLVPHRCECTQGFTFRCWTRVDGCLLCCGDCRREMVAWRDRTMTILFVRTNSFQRKFPTADTRRSYNTGNDMGNRFLRAATVSTQQYLRSLFDAGYSERHGWYCVCARWNGRIRGTRTKCISISVCVRVVSDGVTKENRRSTLARKLQICVCLRR